MAKENNNKYKIEELLKPKNDIVFQSLFNQSNEKITKAFVEALIEKKIYKIKINDIKELYRENPQDKLGILDLEIDVDNEQKVDIEIQLVKREKFAERLLYYFSRLYANEIKIGDDYDKSKKVIIIAIIDYDLELTKELKKMTTKWKLREEENSKLILTDCLEVDIIELSKVREEYNKNKENEKAQWIMFLDNPNSKEVKEIMEKNEEIKDAVVTVHHMSEDEKLRKLAELREKAILDEKAIKRAAQKDGFKIGHKEGIKEGIKEEKINIAKKMKEMGLSIQDIVTATGLLKEDLEKL